jgi:GntR family transcriptional regulator/MocR family aminotransferase
LDLALILPDDGPRGARLVEALREAILSGRLPLGAKLPASRLLAAQLDLSRGTVVAAYEELISEGYCTARVGDGTFVAVTSRPTPRREAAARIRLSRWGQRVIADSPVSADDQRPRIDFSPGVSPESFPAAALARALRRAVDRIDGMPAVGDPAGSRRLRAALVAHLGRTRGLRADPSQVVVVSGSQQGIDLSARLLLDPDDRLCMEEPGYPRARRAFQAAGATVTPVPIDASGLVTAALPADGARLAYVTPSHQHPTGAVLAPERRLALLQWAEAHDAWILEDDYDSEFRYGGPPLPCLQGLDRSGRCIYAGSLSKLLHPALRVGYLVVPPALVPAVIAAKQTLDQSTSMLTQEALADLFESGEIERHLRRASRAYRARRAQLLAALAATPLPGARVWPLTGGLHVFIELPGIAPTALRRAAERRGLGLVFGDDCFLREQPGTRLILWFGRLPVSAIAPGIAALAAAVGEATVRRLERPSELATTHPQQATAIGVGE